jgi:hypothetical protein
MYARWAAWYSGSMEKGSFGFTVNGNKRDEMRWASRVELLHVYACIMVMGEQRKKKKKKQ